MDYRNDFGQETEVMASEEALHPLNDLLEYLRDYARERPEMAALTCFGIGFILGWKLKPW